MAGTTEAEPRWCVKGKRKREDVESPAIAKVSQASPFLFESSNCFRSLSLKELLCRGQQVDQGVLDLKGEFARAEKALHGLSQEIDYRMDSPADARKIQKRRFRVLSIVPAPQASRTLSVLSRASHSASSHTPNMPGITKHTLIYMTSHSWTNIHTQRSTLDYK